jgi:hypothetical protein
MVTTCDNSLSGRALSPIGTVGEIREQSKIELLKCRRSRQIVGLISERTIRKMRLFDDKESGIGAEIVFIGMPKEWRPNSTKKSLSLY